MGGMTIRIVPIEPPWFEEKAQVQSCTWRELNQGHIPPVYHHIGPYQQQNHECRQTDDRGK